MFDFFKNKKRNFEMHYGYDGRLLDDNIPFAVLESYKKLRTNLIFSSGGQKTPVFAVTSYEAKTGKSITSSNIAISFAMLGKKVLLIDGDLRCPTLHKFFDADERSKGLSEMLSGISSVVFHCLRTEM